jgi:histidinol phosphatase-like enzyme
VKIIFLDIDGPLNTKKHVMEQVKNGKISWYEAQFNFDPDSMKNLQEIAEKTDARIVIISTWGGYLIGHTLVLLVLRFYSFFLYNSNHL